MLDWLFRSDFDGVTAAAIWSILIVLATTITIFVYTLGLRWVMVVSTHQRTQLVARWRSVFAAATLRKDDAMTISLPPFGRKQRTILLEEWNRARTAVEGESAQNLIILGERLGLPQIARSMLERRKLKTRILAIQTLGNLHDIDSRPSIQDLVTDENTALSITAAVALVQICPDRAVAMLIPLIEKRPDWPRNRVSIFLHMAGSERISEPMYRAIRSADNSGKTCLLQFAHQVEASVLDALVEDLIRESNDPGVLNAALKLVSGHAGVPRIAALIRHKTWFVRVQAAKVLGRVGQQEHLSLLESMLHDEEWWVRYRAAQAIASLPFLGPNKLRQLQHRQSDPFAADMLQQAYAEVGLA
ncbi:MAG: HEAT repeat domain-containing protein [Proteobacteria bacterium]|nr:HEAT repeat domain-containing protein [Pseudomonadota bacterium]